MNQERHDAVEVWRDEQFFVVFFGEPFVQAADAAFGQHADGMVEVDGGLAVLLEGRFEFFEAHVRQLVHLTRVLALVFDMEGLGIRLVAEAFGH